MAGMLSRLVSGNPLPSPLPMPVPVRHNRHSSLTGRGMYCMCNQFPRRGDGIATKSPKDEWQPARESTELGIAPGGAPAWLPPGFALR